MLKPRQREMLAILLGEEGPVTTTYLQKVMGYKVDRPVAHHLSALERHGLLKPRQRFEHRAIRLNEAGRAMAAALVRQAA